MEKAENAGADIRGFVADSTNGERIIGANVMIAGTTRGATTNNNGFFLIASVPPGTYELTAGAVGYARRVLRVTVSGTDAVTLNIRLTPQDITLREVVVRSASISPLEGRGASVHVITPRELQQIPAAAQPDFLRSLQLLPGITSTSDVSAKFYVRGGAGDQNLILLDGMKLYNPFHASGLFSVIDQDLVRGADVYTGAFPAGYGGRLSSVVNVTTKDGNQSKISGVANINSLSGKLQLDGPLGGDNSWVLSARSSLFTNALNKMIPYPSPTKFYDAFVKGTVGTSNGRIGFRGYTSGDDVEPTEPDQPDHSWRNSAFSVFLSSLASDRLFFDASISYSRSEIKRIPKPGSGVFPGSSRLEELTIHGEATSYTEDAGTFHEGFEFAFPTIADDFYSYNGFPQHYAESAMELYLWLRYEGRLGGFHYDVGVHSDITLLINGAPLRQGLQPRLTMAYDFGNSWVAKASYGIFTQKIIGVSNEDDLISLFDAWLYLPEALQPEEAHHYVLGLEGNIFPWLATSIQAYTKQYRAITVYNSAKVFPDDPDYINGTGFASGVEFLLRYSSPIMDLYGTYAWSRVSLTSPRLTYTPRYERRHSVKALLSFRPLPELETTLRWEYGSGYPFTQDAGMYTRLPLSELGTSPFPGGEGTPVGALGPKNAARLPAYHRLDAGISYRIPAGMFRMTFAVSVLNVFGVQNILYYDRTTGKTDYMIPFFPTASITVEF